MWEFIQQNPELTVLTVLYLIMNIAPRPHPDEHTGWRRILWLILDRLSVLHAAAMPGRFKWLMLPTPPREPVATEGKDEGKKDQP